IGPLQLEADRGVRVRAQGAIEVAVLGARAAVEGADGDDDLGRQLAPVAQEPVAAHPLGLARVGADRRGAVDPAAALWGDLVAGGLPHGGPERRGRQADEHEGERAARGRSGYGWTGTRATRAG